MKGDGAKDEDWLEWVNGRELKVPKERFNIHSHANAAFLVDWTAYDGYYYLLYAGNKQGYTHSGRGRNRIGFARSKNLMGWKTPPQ